MPMLELSKLEWSKLEMSKLELSKLESSKLEFLRSNVQARFFVDEVCSMYVANDSYHYYPLHELIVVTLASIIYFYQDNDCLIYFQDIAQFLQDNARMI